MHQVVLKGAGKKRRVGAKCTGAHCSRLRPGDAADPCKLPEQLLGRLIRDAAAARIQAAQRARAARKRAAARSEWERQKVSAAGAADSWDELRRRRRERAVALDAEAAADSAAAEREQTSLVARFEAERAEKVRWPSGRIRDTSCCCHPLTVVPYLRSGPRRGTCRAGICAWCLADCGADAHQHVANCPHALHDRQDNPVFGVLAQFHQVHRARQTAELQQ